MNGKGNCYDNAVTESFYKTLKTELVYQNHYILRKQVYHSVSSVYRSFFTILTEDTPI